MHIPKGHAERRVAHELLNRPRRRTPSWRGGHKRCAGWRTSVRASSSAFFLLTGKAVKKTQARRRQSDAQTISALAARRAGQRALERRPLTATVSRNEGKLAARDPRPNSDARSCHHPRPFCQPPAVPPLPALVPALPPPVPPALVPPALVPPPAPPTAPPPPAPAPPMNVVHANAPIVQRQ
jgi:hypothetical protein